MFDIKTLHEPRTLAEALELLAARPDARILGAGSDSLVKLHEGKLGGLEWISIHTLDELRRIEVETDGTLRIGALSSFSSIADSPIVRRLAGSLCEAVSSIGGPQVRNMGTIGGNLSNGVPSADSASTCFAWDANIELTSKDGSRVIPVGEYYISAGKVSRRPDELLTAVLIPKSAYEGYKGSFYKYAMRNAMDIATVNASATVKVASDRSTIEDARIAFGVAAPTPIRIPHAEQVLIGQPISRELIDQAAEAALQDTRARDSWRASKAFREHMLKEMTRRILTIAIRRAGGDLQGDHA